MRADTKRRLATLVVGGGIALLAASCGQITTPVPKTTTPTVAAAGGGVTAVPTAVTTQGVTTASMNLDILTGKMIGKPGWPMYTPADFTLPAHARVTITIRDFDSGVATPSAPYLQVTGTVGGTETVVNQVLGNPDLAAGKTVRSLAADDVAHTFTVPSLGVNVPIPPSSTVQFTIQTGNPGTYTWMCMAPCGTGPAGTGGPMVTDGYMMGTITVVG